MANSKTRRVHFLFCCDFKMVDWLRHNDLEQNVHNFLQVSDFLSLLFGAEQVVCKDLFAVSAKIQNYAAALYMFYSLIPVHT